jgi:hypothetical protein
MTNEIKYGKKAIKKGLVLKTWKRVLKMRRLSQKTGHGRPGY